MLSEEDDGNNLLWMVEYDGKWQWQQKADVVVFMMWNNRERWVVEKKERGAKLSPQREKKQEVQFINQWEKKKKKTSNLNLPANLGFNPQP